MERIKTSIKNIEIIEIIENTIEKFEKAFKSIETYEIIGEPRFGERKNKNTGEDEFYYKALVKI